MDSSLSHTMMSDLVNEMSSDLSALAWVHDELQRSLDSAHKALRRVVKESESEAGSDVGTVDPGVLRIARQQIHQGVGALDLVGLPDVANVLRASEAAVSRFIGKPSKLTSADVDVIEQASFALLDYLQRLLAGKPVSQLALFPRYQALQGVAGAERAHPADLWTYDWRWRELPAEPGVVRRTPDAEVRGMFEQQLLLLMRGQLTAASASMSEICASLGAGATAMPVATLWRLAAAFFESQSLGLVKVDVFCKRVASRLLAQFRVFEHGESAASERLAIDLLFFCAQSLPTGSDRKAPRLTAVRQVYGLSQHAPVDYESSRLGRFDPSLIAQARKRVASAKDAWSAVAGGEMHRLTGLSEQFSLVGESLKRIYPNGEMLADELHKSVLQAQHAGAAPNPSMAMEVATSVLYLEASLQDADFDNPEEAQRVRRLAQRVAAVRAGHLADPLEAWMEELYRRVSDRQTMGSVVQELRVSLSEAEKLIDQFFRKPSERIVLIPVPGQLASMRGVFSVLGIEQAALAVQRMREDVEGLIETEVDPLLVVQSGTFERLAGNLGALGFLIDMLGVQPNVAKSLFVYNPKLGALSPLMGRSATARKTSMLTPPPMVESRLVEQVQSLSVTAISDRVPLDEVSRDLELLSQKAQVADHVGLLATVSQAQIAIEHAVDEAEVAEVREQLSEALADFVASASEPVGIDSVPVPPPSYPIAAAKSVFADLGDDPEMREIFLEEAREVVLAAKAALDQMEQVPSDIGSLTTLRRGFHTLKGSSRMVGLKEFGEAAWACEQIYNTWLATQKAADPTLLEFTNQALVYLTLWVDSIGGQPIGTFSAAPVKAAAEAFGRGESVQLLKPSAPAVVAGEAEPIVKGGEHKTVAQLTDDELDIVSFSLGLPDLVEDEVPAKEESAAVPDAMQDVFLDDLQVTESLPNTPEDAPDFVVNEVEFGVVSIPNASPAQAELLMPSIETMDLDFETGPTGTAESAAERAVSADGLAPNDGAVQGPTGLESVPVASVPDEDQVKVVGSLRISIPLLNIYLNEADELSRRLMTEVAEWAMELHRPVGEVPIALAHSLAGSSATVGFSDLSQLARLLEHALTRTQAIGYGTAEEGQLFIEVTEEIRRLLHQFAAGFLKTTSPELLTRLAEHELSSAVRLQAANASADTRSTAGSAAPEVAQASIQSQIMPLAEPTVERPPSDLTVSSGHTMPRPGIHTGLGQSEFKPLTAKASGVLHSVSTHPTSSSATASDDEDIDAIDAVDAELFPIFEEEGDELLPQLATKLREWSRHPNDLAPASSCMRTLHTLKGGARLAGAMRLGAMAHRLETSIEHLLNKGEISSADVEALLVRSDSLTATFEALRSRDAQAYAEAASVLEATAAPEPAPIVRENAPVVPTALPTVVPFNTPLASAAIPTTPAVARPVQGETRTEIDWARFPSSQAVVPIDGAQDRAVAASSATVRVRGSLLERLVNQAGEVSIARSRIDSEVRLIRSSLGDLTENLERLRQQLRDIEFQAETQITSRMEAAKAAQETFDPLESDRFTRFQELTRMMAESVNDVATVQRTIHRILATTEDELAAQARLTRDLQDDLLRTRMVEFDSQSDRLYRVVRLAAKETGKHVRLDIVGGTIEMDRGVLDRMTPAFEHLLRNCVTHGIESPEARTAVGKDPTGNIVVSLHHEGNEVGVEFRDDGAGLGLDKIRAKGVALGLIKDGVEHADAEIANLIFTPGFSTADSITELSGRGVGLDVVRAEVNAMGGRIETATAVGQGTSFKLQLPLTTAVTKVGMLRCGATVVAVPATLIEIVRRASAIELNQCYEECTYTLFGNSMPFYWFGALLQQAPISQETGRTRMIVVIKSAQQRIALHVDEVLGAQEVVVKNLGPQLVRLPGLAGMTLLASGAVALIYNPVALATLYGEAAWKATYAARQAPANQAGIPVAAAPSSTHVQPLVLVVDDSLTVRRVTQRLLVREGYRVVLAKDGIEGLERLAEERPQVVLSDIEMPRMDGFDLVRNIRADARLKDLPVIMITSRIAQKHRDYAAELGVNHYLGKPYSEEDLIALIARYTLEPVTSG